MDVGGLIHASAFAAVVMAGLLAGMNATGVITHTAGLRLQPAAWTQRHQVEDQVFRRVMPLIVLGALVALATAAMTSSGLSRGLFAGAGALTLAILLTTTRLIALNRRINTWDGASPPPEMPATRALWLRWHVVRTAAAFAVFALTAIAVVW